MNTVIVDPEVVVAAPSRRGHLCSNPSICHDDTLLRSALPFRTHIATTAGACPDESNAAVTLAERALQPHRFSLLQI